MFQYHNGRLYPDVTPRKLSFKIPDGYWIDTFPEGNSSNCIALLAKDQSVKIEVSVEMSRWKSTEKEATDEFEGAPPIEISGPNPICIGGFKGHSIYCFSNPSQYVVILDISECNLRGAFNLEDRFNRMEIVVTANCGSEDESIVALKDAIHDCRFEELLESISVKE
ncbi:MAG: hypothetical protein LUC87_06025 [Clostridiales bacterium]|nr:hypothetical protein [Clostridiales bacterium]